MVKVIEEFIFVNFINICVYVNQNVYVVII